MNEPDKEEQVRRIIRNVSMALNHPWTDSPLISPYIKVRCSDMVELIEYIQSKRQTRGPFILEFRQQGAAHWRRTWVTDEERQICEMAFKDESARAKLLNRHPTHVIVLRDKKSDAFTEYELRLTED